MMVTNSQLERRCVAGTRATLRAGTTDRLAWACGGIAAVLMCLVGCESVQSEPEGEELAASPVEVRVATAEVRTLQPELKLVGPVVAIPEQTAVVSPQLGGWITKVAVIEGQRVHAGDVLVEFDARAAEVAWQRAKAVVREKKATLERLKKGPLPQEIAAARQMAQQAKATVAALRKEVSALRELLDREEVSEVVYNNKAKALEGAVAAAAAAEERVKLLQAGTRPELIEEARGLLEAAEADEARAQLELQWCTVASPIDGIVTQLVARRGQFFNAAQPLATIVDLSSVFVQLRIPELQSADVKVGTPVTVRLEAQPSRVFQGSIARMASQADPATGNIVAFARIENKDGVLRTGQSCQAVVELPPVTGAMVVPVSAVADHDGQAVVTVIRENRAHETPVETGVEANGYVQIIKGLSAGDQVATSGGYGLPEGCPVKIISDAAESKRDETHE